MPVELSDTIAVSQCPIFKRNFLMVSTRMNVSRAIRVFAIGLVGLVVSTMTAGSVVADDGHPVAIRNWEQGITIETMWGFQIGLGVKDASVDKLPRKSDLVLEDVGVGESVTLQRLPNQAEPSVLRGVGANNAGNAVVVKRGQAGSPAMVMVDGLTIVYLDAAVDVEFAKRLEGKQVVVVATGAGLNSEMYAAIFDALKPKLMVVKAGVEKVGDQAVESVSHNTVAVSSGKQAKAKAKARIVSLGNEGYKLSKELTTLFEKKEAACKKSREVFAKLSVAQMNFKPANGTHTPRWNTEHMMGRELQFFSQIYHAVDPEVPVMNLNPAQMPDRYKFAHEDWTGEEEARQTQRVEDFTRRFAYMLDGMSLNKRAKGSRFWTPKSLLAQMEKHYNQHTGNVVKKMELDGWPTE